MSPAQPDPTTLFPVADTQPKTCTARDCEAGTRKNLCRYDADRDVGELVGKRPRGCLNRYDPATAQLPEGY